MGKLDGKVAILSGGAGGIAFEEARLFLQEGAKVLLGDIRDELGRKAEAELAETGGDVSYHRLDVTNEDDWRAIVALAESRHGKLDILVNNAGITIPKPLEETTADDWDRTMDVNAKGVFLGTKYAVEAMKKVGGGAIVNISSGAALAGTSHFIGSYGPEQGRRPELHQDNRFEVCPGQHTLQRHISRPHRHAHFVGIHRRHPGSQEMGDRIGAPWPGGSSSGHSQGCAVSGVRRRRMDYRLGPRHRRRQ